MSEVYEDDLRRRVAAFPPVATAQWERKMRSDLGRAYDLDRLIWHPHDEVALSPFYRAEDLDRFPHLTGKGAPARVRASWRIMQLIPDGAPEATTRRMQAAIAGGAEIIALDPCDPRDSSMLNELAASSETGDLGVHVVSGPNALAHLVNLVDALEPTLPAPLTADYDPFSEWAMKGRCTTEQLNGAAHTIAALPDGVRPLCAGGAIFHESGANVVDETACALAAVSEYLVRLSALGWTCDQALQRMYVSLQIDSSYFIEIARLRAVRILLPMVIGAFDAHHASMHVPIHAWTSRRSQTLYDPHTNLLRATTEAASAVIGGCDVLAVRPFDEVSGTPSDHALRLARNVQHLLREEANLRRIPDPAAGSYYIEAVTHEIARAIWHRFQDVEQRGGLVSAIEDGYIERLAASSQQRLQESVRRRDRILVGTNQFPEPDGKRLDDVSGPPDHQGVHAPALLPAIRRLAEPLERVRLRTEAYAMSSGHTPSAGILPVGDRWTRNTRAAFAANVLGCGGFDVQIVDGIDSQRDVLSAITAIRADVLMVTADEAFDLQVLHDIRRHNLFDVIGLYVRDQVIDEADFNLHRGVDLVEVLTSIQEQLGIDTDEDLVS